MIEADTAGLDRFMKRSEGTSELLERLRDNLKRATEPDLKKRLTDSIQYVEETDGAKAP